MAPILSAAALTACGGSGDEGNLVWIDGTNLNKTVNKAGVYDIEITGVKNDVTIAAGNTVGRLDVTGANNRIFLTKTATIRKVEMTGRNNTLYVPPGFQATVANAGQNNDIVERP